MSDVVDLVSDEEDTLPLVNEAEKGKKAKEKPHAASVDLSSTEVVDLVSDDDDEEQSTDTGHSPEAGLEVKKDVNHYVRVIDKLVEEALRNCEEHKQQSDLMEELLTEIEYFNDNISRLEKENVVLKRKIDEYTLSVNREMAVYGRASGTSDGYLKVEGPFELVLPICPTSNRVNRDAAYTTDDEFVLTGTTRKICFEESNDETSNCSRSSDLEELDFNTICYNLIPPAGRLERPKVLENSYVYACTSRDYPYVWKVALVSSVIRKDAETKHYVEFSDKFEPSVYLSAKRIAYSNNPTVCVPMGTRVIAYFKKEPNIPRQEAPLLSGMVAETPKLFNDCRYLIFFDHGGVCYVTWEEIHLIVEQSDAWEEFLSEDTSFVKKYCSEFPERAMIKFQKGEKMKVFVDGNWKYGQVQQIDCSLVRFDFENPEKSEWLYRGSPRLYRLYVEFHDTRGRSGFRPRRNRLSKTTTGKLTVRSFIQYTNEEVDLSEETPIVRTQIAKKSTTKIPTELSVSFSRTRSKPSSSPPKEVVLIKIPEAYVTNSLVLKEYKTHSCFLQCVSRKEYDMRQFRDTNPLAVPILLEWQRNEVKSRRNPYVEYITPCGKSLLSIGEVAQFLYVTHCSLPIALFTFELVKVYSTRKERVKCYYFDEDLAKGKEIHSISVINEEDENGGPEVFEYSADRLPGKGVQLPLDPRFLPCCNCSDNCKNKQTCKCQQLTTDAMENDAAGYEHSRLYEFVTTGIFECNQMCSCNKNCPNKVVQNGITAQLQLFKTAKKGWGVRCLHDLPRGAFICTYSAEVINDTTEPEDDKYFADLDYIDVCEGFKEDYESAAEPVSESEPEEVDYYEKEKTRKRRRIVEYNSSDDEASTVTKKHKEAKFSIRKYYDEDFSYTLDAQKIGNIGRFLNHSCSPNSFVQNIFVDTHDLRFPWVGLFAARNIPAFEEIAWDYNYEVGSVEGKKLYCHCGSSNCRGRLL